MKKLMVFLVFALSLSLCSFTASEESALGAAEGELESLYEDFLALLPDGIDTDAILGAEGIFELLSALAEPRSAIWGELLGNLALFFAAALIFATAELVFADTGFKSTASRAICAALSVPTLISLSELLSVCRCGLESGSEFFSGVIPIVTTALAIGCGAGSAATSASGMSLTLGFVSQILSGNLYLIFGVIFSLSLIGNIDTGKGVGALSKSTRNTFGFIIGAVSLVIGGTLALQTTLSVSRDTLALRGAKYAISGMVPVVGGVISGSLSTLISGVKLLSSAIGTLSVLTVVSFMGMPLLSLFIYRAALGACATLSSYFAADLGQRFFEAARGAVDCLVAIVATSLLLYVLELAIFMTAVGSVAV